MMSILPSTPQCSGVPRPGPVETLTARLGAMGIGIRQLELPITALETLFFRLTEHHTADEAAAA